VDAAETSSPAPALDSSDDVDPDCELEPDCPTCQESDCPDCELEPDSPVSEFEGSC
jgi:hypothetical protein